ncbi:MAG: hypothetical protein ACOX87_13630, partial [Chloroflexota bacterium]
MRGKITTQQEDPHPVTLRSLASLLSHYGGREDSVSLPVPASALRKAATRCGPDSPEGLDPLGTP